MVIGYRSNYDTSSWTSIISNPDLTLFDAERWDPPFHLAVGDLGSRLELQPFEPFTKLNFLIKKIAIIKQLLDSAFAQGKDLCLSFRIIKLAPRSA